MESLVYAIIDFQAFKHNIDFVRKIRPKKKIILPVKANGYGHGDRIISDFAKELEIEYLAVARINEGIILRQNGVKLPIICLGSEFGINYKYAIENDIELSVSSLSELEVINDFVSEKIAKVHINIDTGMSRLGCLEDEAKNMVNFIKNTKKIKISSVWTHFAKSDEDINWTKKQLEIFGSALSIFKDFQLDMIHHSNSGGIENLEDDNWTNAVRPGIMSYGYSQKIGFSNMLLPVMTLISKVVHIKKVPAGTYVGYGSTYRTKNETLLATISLGYGDGFFRQLSNNFDVEINGRVYKSCGRISMDLIVVEVDQYVKVGDEVIIFGKDAINDANSLAKKIGTISYEVLTNVSPLRVERVVKK